MMETTTTPHHPATQEEDGEYNAAPSRTSTALKLLCSAALLVGAAHTVYTNGNSEGIERNDNAARRRLLTSKPSYVDDIHQELKDRQKLFDDTPPEEVKYWFEYSGPLQRYYYRYSKSRKKADSFEGRDDSGIISGRFSEIGGGDDYIKFAEEAQKVKRSNSQNTEELRPYNRLKDNCLALGTAAGGKNWSFLNNEKVVSSEDLCKVLILLNMVGAGQGTTVLWETPPPSLVDSPRPWQSEQETAAMHLERNLREINAMCATGDMAVRVQVLVCEPIPAEWTNWMDSLLVDCGGSPLPSAIENAVIHNNNNDETRYSPLQIVVSSSPDTADTCHNLKSGFMEKRMQDLMLAAPSTGSSSFPKTTHQDLISTDDFDVYIGAKWSSLITTRTVNSFLQASNDLAAAANSDLKISEQKSPEIAHMGGPTSPFLVPSFVRMSYVSEENNKVAKWRMHGDFFHPAAWEVCRDSFDMTWIPHSLSHQVCDAKGNDASCGQWWLYMAEEQMPTTPEVYANEETVPLVRGGSNFVYMLTERHRREIVDNLICKRDGNSNCGQEPQAVIPLGDLESFVVNFMPNTALGKKHQTGRRPGYSRPYNSEENRVEIKEKKKLKDQEDIEKALFDYTVYPAALMRKDATLKAARARDATFNNIELKDGEAYGIPKKVKSQYYDVSIIKPRDALNGWCMSLARRGLCVLYADYLRSGDERRCAEHCGLSMDWTSIDGDVQSA